MAVNTIFWLATLVATVATKSIQAGLGKRAAEEEAALAKEQEKKEAERREKVRKLQKRDTDIEGLGRQLSKRRGAEQVARQVPGAQPIDRGRPPPPPPPSMQPLSKPSAAKPTVASAPLPTAGAQQRGISPEGLDAIGSGIELAGQVGAGITGAAAAANEVRARKEEADRLAKLEEKEFEKNLAAKKRDVNLRGLDFQSKVAAGPGASSRQNTFATDFMNVLRSVKNPRKVI